MAFNSKKTRKGHNANTTRLDLQHIQYMWVEFFVSQTAGSTSWHTSWYHSLHLLQSTICGPSSQWGCRQKQYTGTDVTFRDLPLRIRCITGRPFQVKLPAISAFLTAWRRPSCCQTTVDGSMLAQIAVAFALQMPHSLFPFAAGELLGILLEISRM